MKISAIDKARSIWLFPTLFLNPRGLYILPVVCALAERYKFAVVPEKDAVGKEPLSLKFENGCFINKEGVPIFVGLQIHPDGIVGDTRSSTSDTDDFLEDCLTWFSETYNLPSHHELAMKKIYVSEMAICLERPLALFNEKFIRFANKISNGFERDANQELQLSRLSFAPDPTSKGRGAFVFERMAQAPFSENKYFSSAPLTTAEHLSLLEEFEAAAT